jgi:hypothetical protein
MIAALLSYLASQVLVWCITSLVGPLATVRPMLGAIRVVVRNRNVIGALDSTSMGVAIRTLCMACLWLARILAVVGTVCALCALVWYCRSWWRMQEVRPSAAARLVAMGLESSDEDLSAEIAALDDEGVQGDAAHQLGIQALSQRTNGQRQRRRRASAFLRYWVAAVRLEFPLRADRPSDRGAMSKWLTGKLRARNMRYVHIENAVPRVVSLALNKSRAEVEADVLQEDARIRTVGGRLLYNLRQLFLASAGLGEPVAGD